jgi:hypothetical protein
LAAAENTPPQSDSTPQSAAPSTDNSPNTQQESEKKPTLAEYCKEHTC